MFGIGVDPSVQIDVLSELQLGDSVAGVRQVQGLHNGSKAFFFQGRDAHPFWVAAMAESWFSGKGRLSPPEQFQSLRTQAFDWTFSISFEGRHYSIGLIRQDLLSKDSPSALKSSPISCSPTPHSPTSLHLSSSSLTDRPFIKGQHEIWWQMAYFASHRKPCIINTDWFRQAEIGLFAWLSCCLEENAGNKNIPDCIWHCKCCMNNVSHSKIFAFSFD